MIITLNKQDAYDRLSHQAATYLFPCCNDEALISASSLWNSAFISHDVMDS